MSIRQFSVQPCPDCERDTTHVSMKCRECGHINMTGYEASTRMRNRLFARGKANVYFEAKRIHARNVRQNRRAIPTSTLETGRD